MSKITVGGQAPSASGDVSIALNNLSDVDTTGVASGNVIAYNGSSYEASSSAISLGVVFLGSAASRFYQSREPHAGFDWEEAFVCLWLLWLDSSLGRFSHGGVFDIKHKQT